MKPTEEQLKRLMYLISCEALLDQESIGDRFMFENEDGHCFLLDFLEWLKEKNSELYETYKEFDVDVAQVFWLEDEEGGEYDIFRECVVYIYEHPEALKGVIKELEDKELDRYSDWIDVDIDTNGLITSFADFEKELKELKKEL
jgi:hypothetical protein